MAAGTHVLVYYFPRQRPRSRPIIDREKVQPAEVLPPGGRVANCAGRWSGWLCGVVVCVVMYVMCCFLIDALMVI